MLPDPIQDQKNIMAMEFNPEYYVVTRAYLTRHGNGPMPGEGIPHSIEESPWETNNYDQHQGYFRKTILDLDLLQYGVNRDAGIRKNGFNLVINCLDQLRDGCNLVFNGKVESYDNYYNFITKINKELDPKLTYCGKSPFSRDMEVF